MRLATADDLDVTDRALPPTPCGLPAQHQVEVGHEVRVEVQVEAQVEVRVEVQVEVLAA